MKIETGQAIEITRLKDGLRMYTGIASLDQREAEEQPEKFKVKVIQFKGCCIYANINDRAHDGFPIEIDGVDVKNFLDEIATDQECQNFFD